MHDQVIAPDGGRCNRVRHQNPEELAAISNDEIARVLLQRRLGSGGKENQGSVLAAPSVRHEASRRSKIGGVAIAREDGHHEWEADHSSSFHFSPIGGDEAGVATAVLRDLKVQAFFHHSQKTLRSDNFNIYANFRNLR